MTGAIQAVTLNFMEISLEILLILLLILLNGVLSMAEFALIASRKGRLQERARQGDQRAKTALELVRDPADFLSTIQIGITLVGVLAGAFGGVAPAKALAGVLERIPLLAPYSSGIAVGIVVLLITLLTLVFGELAPKRLALTRPERFAAVLALPMKSLSRLAAPLVRLLSSVTGLVLKILGAGAPVETPASEEEIRLMIAQATRAGVFLEAEEDLVSGVFRLGDRRASTLITPRTEIEWLDLDDSLESNLRKVKESPHSRFPVGRGSLDDVSGVIVAKDLLRCCLDGSPPDLETCMLPPVFVPENTAAPVVLDLFRTTDPPMVLVLDEYGGLQGLLTIHDILEPIIGEFNFPNQPGEQQIYRRADGSWLVDGLLPVDGFMEAFHISEMPDYDRGYYETMGGFVMSRLGKIPATGDTFEWGGLSFEIIDMDGLRVDKILVKKNGDAPSSTENL